MARDGWRVFDWDYGVVDPRFARKPVLVGAAAGGPTAREVLARLEVPAKSALAGTMITVLFGWPSLLIAKIFGGFGSRAFGAALGAVAVVSSLACWAVTSFEQRTVEQRREHVPDHADPPPWK